MQVNREGIAAFIASECIKYDEVQITYKERGAAIIVEGSDRGVKTRQTDAVNDTPPVAKPAECRNARLYHQSWTGGRAVKRNRHSVKRG